MIVAMKPGASRGQVQHVADLVNDFGLKEHARSDGAQSITPATMNDLIPVPRRIAQAIGRQA